MRIDNLLIPENSYTHNCSCGVQFLAHKGSLDCHKCLYDEIESLKQELGLTKIGLEHRATLLASCESALEGRDEQIESLRAQLDKSQELFTELYQVLGSHDASELAMDICLAASDGELRVGELLPYFVEENDCE
jgi:hypothetical protein